MPKVIFAKTHAAFLNQVFNTNYKSYMKSRWVYDESTIVWMIRMDPFIQIKLDFCHLVLSPNFFF